MRLFSGFSRLNVCGDELQYLPGVVTQFVIGHFFGDGAKSLGERIPFAEDLLHVASDKF
jgi:hypothetical protein